MQSDLLGAHAMGVRNVLLVTGDPPKVGDYPDATAVFDVDSIGLANVVSRLNGGVDIGGQPIGQPDRVPYRRRGQPRRAEPRRGAAPLRLQGRGGRRVRDHPAGLRRRRVPRLHRRGSSTHAHPDPGRHHAARERAARRIHGQRSARACACPTRWWSGCAARRPTDELRDEGHGDRPRNSRGDPSAGAAASRSRPRPGPSTWPWGLEPRGTFLPLSQGIVL